MSGVNGSPRVSQPGLLERSLQRKPSLIADGNRSWCVHCYSWCADVEERKASLLHLFIYCDSRAEEAFWRKRKCLSGQTTGISGFQGAVFALQPVNAILIKHNQGKFEVRLVHLFPKNTLDYLTHSLT